MEHITINSDRSVTVPVELRKIGVQYDHNVNTIEFVGPRYSSNVDLSTMTIYINYILSDKTPGKYKAENVIIDDQDDSLIRFNWTITRNVTKVSGILSCLVCAKKTDEEGNEINHWNTDIFRLLSVSEGMENDSVIQEQYPDVITSLIQNVEEHDTKLLEFSGLNNRVTDLENNVNEHDAKLLEFSGLDTRVTDIENNVNELKDDLDNFFEEGNIVDATKNTAGFYINRTTGNLTQNPSYYTTDYLRVNEGDVIQFSETARFLCAFNSNKIVEAKYGAENIRAYTVPNGIRYIRVSMYIDYADSFCAYVSDSWEGFKPYGKNPIEGSFDTLTRKCITSLGTNGFRSEFNLNASNTKEFLDSFPWYNKVGDCISFRAEFTSFDVLWIGKGYYRNYGAWLEITSTNVSIKRYNGSIANVGTWQHGLTISDFIYVVINTNNKLEVQFTIASKSGSYTLTPSRSYDFLSVPFVRSGSDLTNCKFSMTNDSFNKSLWVFGDSYWGLTTDRVYGALRQIGYPNIYVNNLPGQTSQDAYNDLIKAFKYGSPKYLVWCLGINDSDLDNYKKYLNYVASICAENGVELIVAKAPSIPNGNKTEQHNYIDSMGFRYVDFNSAVGATSDGAWYDGMLSADLVHPTDLGAKMMSMQMFIDVPEIANYGKI